MTSTQEEQDEIFIVAVDSWVTYPAFTGFPYTLIQHSHTSPQDLPSRIQNATIVCTSATPITHEAILSASKLRLISTNATGTDNISKQTAAECGVSVSHVPAQNSESVTEHAFALLSSLKRKILPMHSLTVQGQGWPIEGGIHPAMGPPPRTNREEILVVIGYGALGKCVERMGRALGMKVIIAERKGATEIREGRMEFGEALEKGTAFVIVAPLDESTRNMIGAVELEAMGADSYLVNVGRGGVIDEKALVDALRRKVIAGAAVDVFPQEPATKTNSLLIDDSIPNLILSPHIAWYSQATITGTMNTVKGNIEVSIAMSCYVHDKATLTVLEQGFMLGKPQNLVVDARNKP